MLSTGEIIDGKYRTIRLIGEGGMGAVYEAENIRIHRKVAIKVLHAGVAETAEAVQRFEREAQAAGRIGSEHIVEVLDLGNLPSGDRYMVMEFMDGDSLSGRIQKKGRLTPAELYPIAHQLLAALDAAHGAGIIHRDLKPDNVYLLRSRSGVADFVKLLDFGISKFNQLSGDSGFSMTRTGAVMGTPYYMAPEQAKGAKDMDHRVDLYAAGVILYESVTGEVPFNADTFNELLFKIVLEEARPVQHARTEHRCGFRSDHQQGDGARAERPLPEQPRNFSWRSSTGPTTPDRAGQRCAWQPHHRGWLLADGSWTVPQQADAGPRSGYGHSRSLVEHGRSHRGPSFAQEQQRRLVRRPGRRGRTGCGRRGRRDARAQQSAAQRGTAATDHSAPPHEKAKTDALVVAAKAQQAQDDSQAEAAKTADDARKASADHVQAEASAAASAAEVAAAKPKAAVAHAPAAHSAVAAAAPKPRRPPPRLPCPASTGRKIRTSL